MKKNIKLLLTSLVTGLFAIQLNAELVVHFDASTLELEDGDYIEEWGGQAAEGDPIYIKSAAPNEGAAVQFDGESNFGQATLSSSETGDFIVAVVVKPDQVEGAYHNLIDDDDANRPMLWIDNRDPQSYEANFGVGGDGPNLPATNNGLDGWDIVIFDSKNGLIYFNSPTSNYTAPAVTWSPENSEEDFDFFNRDSGQNYQGLISEMRVYNDSADFGNDFASLYYDLKSKWFMPDADMDGMSDQFEVKYGLNKNDASDAELDKDEDGLSNFEESIHNSDPTKSDTDGDGLTDYNEVKEHGTLPYLVDSDEDGLNDIDEIKSDPPTDPMAGDSDKDGRSDYEEIKGEIKTNPIKPDTDGDGYSDGEEIAQDADPNDPTDFPGSLPPIVHLDASTLDLEDGDSVSEWGGLLPNEDGEAFYQAEATPNGGPAVDLDMWTHFGEVTLEASSAGDFIVAVVLEPNDLAGIYHNLIEDDDSNRPMIWIDNRDPQSYEANLGGATLPLTNSGEGEWDILIFDSRRGKIYFNSATPNFEAPAVRWSPESGSEKFDLFNRDGGASYEGFVAEFRVYNNAMAFGADFEGLFMELRSKWIINDRDKDGMSDEFEDEHGLSKNNPSDASLDKDSDGLDNLQESILGLNPTSTDSDEDGLSDGDEFALYKTNPALEDTDEDGISDGDELNGDPATNPLNADTDSDGLEDGEEINGDPATNPTLADSDNDGVIDILEIEADTDPTDSKSTPPLGSPIVHFDATSLELEDGAVVELWDGKTADGDPVYLKNQSPGGGPAVQFNGDDHFGEAILEPSDSGDFIVMVVVKPDQHGPYHNIIDDDDSNRPMLWVDSRSPQSYEANFGVGGDEPVLPPTNSGHLGWDIVFFDSRNGRMYVNSPVPTHTAPAINWGTGEEMFDFFNRDGKQSYRGLVAEVRIYNNRADIGDSYENIYNQLRRKWIGVSEIKANRSISGDSKKTIASNNKQID